MGNYLSGEILSWKSTRSVVDEAVLFYFIEVQVLGLNGLILDVM